MDNSTKVLEYKCPSCGAGLVFGEGQQKMTCDYCDCTFEMEAVIAYNDALNAKEDSFSLDSASAQEWDQQEKDSMVSFVCQSCGGVLISDSNTAATFCPYCENPAILPTRLAGGVKPEALIPFKTGKEDAKEAFLKLCKGKPLLPKLFMQEHRIEKLTGIYIPFWLYRCDSSFQGSYKATRVRTWSDSEYYYTKTSHYMLRRSCSAGFQDIPVDSSSKTDDTIMESIEPFQYADLVDFHTAYLSGFYADKYDVEAAAGEPRIRERVSNSIDEQLSSTFIGYSSVIPTSKNLQVEHGQARYVLLPVWMLHTKYKDKTYVFAMNGQTGKMTGTFPICIKRSLGWFSAICGGVTLLASLIQLLIF